MSVTTMTSSKAGGSAHRFDGGSRRCISRRRILVALMVASVLLLITSGLSLVLGATYYSPLDILRDPQVFEIVTTFRLPRTCFAILVGAGLSIVGVCYQALFRNYLASPFTLGVSSGAALAASVALMSGVTSARHGLDVSVCAIGGAIVSICLILAVNGSRERTQKNSLLLVGIVYSFFCSSVLTLLQYVSDYSQLFRVTRWMMGGIPSVEWSDIAIGVVCIAAMIAWLIRHERGLDLMLFGDDLAAVKGIDPHRLTRTSFVLTSCVVGWIVAQCGVIGFIGIIVPSICRLAIGLRHKFLIPLSGLVGACLVVTCDLLGRLVIAPFEIPAGVFTAILGGPIFIVLVMRPGRFQGSLL